MIRSRFTSFALLLAVCAAAFGLAATCAAQESDRTLSAADRSYTVGRFALMLDTAPMGFIRSIEGGAITADVVNEPVGPDYFIHKHIGQPKYEDFDMKVGFSMGRPLYDWISTSWGPQPTRKNGAVVALDYQMKVQWEKDFYDALLTEVTIPACDASSKEPAYLAIKLSPELTRRVLPPVGIGPVDLPKGQKTWLPSNFRLSIDGLDCSRIIRIEPFTVKRGVIVDDTGEQRIYAKEPGKIEFPNLLITLSQSSATSWTQWHEDFVVLGNNDASHEREGTLILFAPDMKTELTRIVLHGLGIIKVEPATDQGGGVKRVNAELYCEQMEFVGPGPQPQ